MRASRSVQFLSCIYLSFALAVNIAPSLQDRSLIGEVQPMQAAGNYLPTRDDDDSLANESDPDSETDAAFLYSDVRRCDYERTFGSLDELQSASDQLSTPCIAVYALEVLSQTLESAINNHTSVNDGYDKEFGYYLTYMKNIIPGVLSDQVMLNISATKKCDEFAALGPGMKFFDCELSGSPATRIPCTDLTFPKIKGQSAKLYIRDGDGYAKALDSVGIPLDWTDLGDYTLQRASCEPRATRPYEYDFKTFPTENSTMIVPNPKDIITKGLGNMTDLQISLDATLVDAMLANYIGGSLQDAVQAYSVPVFMFVQAVDNMAQAKALGKKEQDKEEEDERKRKENLILLIITVVLMFIPVVGEEVGSLTGIAGLARTIAIASEVGNAGLAVYDTVQDPSSALLNVLGMMFGAGVIAKASRDGDGLGKVAKVRRGMKPEVIAGLGKLFKDNDDKLQTLMKSCKRPM